MITLKRILVATDFGEAAGSALSYGRALARAFGASLTVLHIVDDVVAAGFAVEGYVPNYFELQRAVDEGAHKQLQGLLTKDDRVELGAIAETRTSRSPAQAIVKYAEDLGADIIIMGTHGRGPMKHLLMGSVAERVVRTAPCPVLTIKHPEHEFVVPDALLSLARA
jgi:nucleotide-binding universal stress UspA family protein